MALSSVEMNINDSRTGTGSGAGTGNHCKIGVSSIESNSPIVIRSSMDTAQIRQLLGKSPLADACIDSVENGASLIYCLPVKASTDGSYSEVQKKGTGAGTVRVSGKPTNAFDVVIEIRTTGATNEATCAISEDGGKTFGDEMTIPLSTKYTLPNTGVELTFECEGSAKFVAGDIYSFSATAPSASNAAILAAANKLRDYKTPYEFIHIVGATTPALWASLEALGDAWEKQYGRPMIFITEQRNAGAEESAATYADTIAKQAKGVNGRHVSVVRSWLRYVRLDGREQDINFAGILCGWLARAKESTSVAYISEFVLPDDKVVRLLPEGIEDYIETIDAGRYVELRTYNGKEGYYVASANMTADESSDYCDLEACRVVYRIARETYQRSLNHLNEDFDQSDPEAALIQVQADLNVPMDQAKDDKIISDGRTVLLVDQMTGGKDKHLPVRVEVQPRGYLRKIILNMYVVNALA